MIRNNKVMTSLYRSLGLVGALITASCCVPGVEEGVVGPLNLGAEYRSDLTKLERIETPSEFDTTSSFYIQAVVNCLKSGDGIVARMDKAGAEERFVAPQDGAVGLFFEFTPPMGGWPAGSHTITVTSGDRTVGSVSFNLK